MKKYRKGRIDISTGRNKRDKCTVTEVRGVRPQRWNGKIVPGARAAAAREKKTGVAEPAKPWWKK